METRKTLIPKQTTITFLLTIFCFIAVYGQHHYNVKDDDSNIVGIFGWYTNTPSNVWVGSLFNKDLSLYASTNRYVMNEVMTIKSSCRVGIGTDSPGEKLTVNGNLELTGDLG